MAVIFRARPAHDRLRLDRLVALEWAAQGLPDLATRGEVQRWIDAGRVAVNGRPGKASQKVSMGAEVRVDPLPLEASAAAADPSVTFEVLFEDDALLVLDKPAGLVVHPAPGHPTGTLVNGLLARGGFELLPAAGDDDVPDPAAHLRPGIVHRLDKGTSGVMVVAKTARAREGLKALFAAHDIERSYLAITVGQTRAGTLDTLHGRSPNDRKRFTSRVSTGRRAITHVAPMESLAGGRATLVRCTLETGRTHQIRVHLSEGRGTPALGDPLYGTPPRDPWLRARGEMLGHQALHAEVLGFVHPITGLPLRFSTPPPADMAELLRELRALRSG